MDKYIYHYTTLETLYKIVSTKSLLLASTKNMNDPLEGSYSVSSFLEDIEGMAKESDYLASIPFLPQLFDKVVNEKESFNKLCGQESTPYVVCFSQKKDNLSHWERYANDSTGVCITFNVDILNNLRLQNFPIIKLRKIYYTSQEIKTSVNDDLLTLYSQISKKLGNEGQELESILLSNGIRHLAAVYQSIQFFIKNEYWNEEDEIRLYYNDKDWNDNIELLQKIEKGTGVNFTEELISFHKTLGLDTIEYHCFSTIRSFRRLFLNAIWGSDLIPEIMLGTFCKQNVQELKDFLKTVGLSKTEIAESKIKIR